MPLKKTIKNNTAHFAESDSECIKLTEQGTTSAAEWSIVQQKQAIETYIKECKQQKNTSNSSGMEEHDNSEKTPELLSPVPWFVKQFEFNTGLRDRIVEQSLQKTPGRLLSLVSSNVPPSADKQALVSSNYTQYKK